MQLSTQKAEVLLNALLVAEHGVPDQVGLEHGLM